MTRARMTLIGFAFLMTLAVIGCGGSPGGAPGRPRHPLPEEPAAFEGEPGVPGGRIVVSTLGAPKTFNVMKSSEASTNDIISNLVFEGLLDYDNQKHEVMPGLASRWEMSPDGRVWTFHLRKGLRWSDGRPLTADDVMFTVSVLADSLVHPSAADILRLNGEFPTFEKVDDRTIRVTTSTPRAAFIHSVSSFRILPRHRLEAALKAGRFNEAWGVDTPPDSLVSNGPFMIAAYDPNQSVTLKPNPWYYRVDRKKQRLPYVDELVFLVAPDQNAEMIRFRAGETDAILVRGEDYQSLRDGAEAGGYTLYDLGPEFGTNLLWFNLNTSRTDDGRPLVDPVRMSWFTNRQFRLAVAHAIDRESLARNVYYGLAEPMYGIIPAVNRAWYNDAIPKYPYDLDRARAILAAAGFTDRNGDGIVEDSAGHRVSFRLYTNSSNRERIASATLIAEDLRKIGLDVNFQPVEMNALTTAIQSSFDYDAILLGGTGGNPPDPMMIVNSLKSSGRTHYWWPGQKRPATPWEAEVDSLVDAQMRLADDAARKVLMDRVQMIYAEEVPAIFTVSRKGTEAIRNRVRNARPSIFRPYAIWNADELWIDAGAAAGRK